jgi:hypothetical protein
MASLKLDDVSEVTSWDGQVDAGLPTLFTIMRDEMLFCPAFFRHYRDLGFEQFIVFDDQSQDGTREYLMAQPDCLVVTSDLRFGAEIMTEEPSGKRKKQRAGVFLKAAIPRLFMMNNHCAYFDADEFLLLPPGIASIVEVLDWMEAEDAKGLLATMVEFFPETVGGLEVADEDITSFSDLLGYSPYFEAEPLFEPGQDGRSHVFLNPSKTARLFDKFEISEDDSAESRPFWKRLAPFKKTKQGNRGARHKCVIMRHADDVFLRGSHNLSAPCAADRFLCLAHFKFAPGFADRVRRAVDWKSHADGALKYQRYDLLLRAMQRTGASFLDPASVRFHGVDQMMEAGLMSWPEQAREDPKSLAH